MDVYTTEEQQVEAIKTWWRDNGKAVMFGAVIGLGALYGWRYYQAEQESHQEKASDAYSQVIEIINLQPERAEEAVDAFTAVHQGGYADLMTLKLAKTFVDKNELTKAAESLRAVQASSDPILKAVATLRLARIEIELGNPDVALDELNKIDSTSWKGQINELRGDIALQKGEIDEAIAAYEASMAIASNQVVQMKLDNLSQ